MRSFTFGRLLKGDVQPGFIYSTSTLEAADWSNRLASVQSAGTHWDVSIKNYTREDILIISSLRTDPIRIPSIYSQDKYRMQETTNFVVIELRMRENVPTKTGDIKSQHSKKIEIRCPSHYLQNHSLFVEELGSYVTVESRLQATRECIAQDSRSSVSREVAVPESAMVVNPVCTFSDYEPLIRECLERADKIKVKVGIRVDVDPFRVPDQIKSMRIAVMDHTFSPYHCNRMEYDPSIDPDDFAIENHHWTASEPLWGKFSDLHTQHNKAYFLDTQEHRTLGGTLCGLAVFGDEQALQDYLFAHRSEEVYEELTQRIIDRNGNHALTKRLEELESLLEQRDSAIEDLRGIVKFEKDQTTTYKRQVTILEDTLKKLKTNFESANGFDAIVMELDNQREALVLKSAEIENERMELRQKIDQFNASHRASMWKTSSEILKSGWGMLLTAITIGTAFLNLYNKLNSKPV